MTNVLIRRKIFVERQTHRKEDPVETKAEITVVQLQVKEC